MFEILALVTLLLGAAHKGKPRRKYRRYLRGAIELTIDVGTLAAGTLAAQVNGDTVEEKTWISSIVARYSLGSVTPIANLGPLVFGVAHSDYTAAEIQEFIDNTGSWKEGDKIAQEVGRRKIKIIGQFGIEDLAVETVAFDHGKKITTKLGWMLTTGQTFDLWIFNQGTVAFTTTDPDLSMVGHANLWPSG